MNIEKLRLGNCVKVLPLVYDESLSYYEQLCKVTKKLNEVIEQFSDLDLSPILLNAISKFIEEQALEFTVSFDEKTETLVFSDKLANTYADGVHIFNPNEHTVTIDEE